MAEPRDPVDVEMDDLAARSAAYMAEHPADGSRASFIREALAGTDPGLVEVAINLADEYLPERAPSKPTPVEVKSAAWAAVDAFNHQTPDQFDRIAEAAYLIREAGGPADDVQRAVLLVESDPELASKGAQDAINDAIESLGLPLPGWFKPGLMHKISAAPGEEPEITREPAPKS